ncbi:HAD family hydrolase [Nocardioides speluncae]|uniref:HAD family hydrolase n=1 Tax=Nocardioides speluncae TaxID=2670337 RepID=UPI00137B789D|nr:HAD family phosphatase [Nocardioides speluncae]
MSTDVWPRAVIFDFNGTLSDDEPLLYRVFSELFMARLGWDLTEGDYFADLAGLSDREIIERGVSRAGRHTANGLVDELLLERSRRYAALVAEENPVRADTRELVAALAATGRSVAITTGAQRADVELVLSRIPEGRHFRVVVTEEDVDRGKPDPQGFLLAAAALGVAPADTVVLEDSVAGIRAARAAGMTVLAVAGTRPAAELAAEGVTVVERLDPGLLDRFQFAD